MFQGGWCFDKKRGKLCCFVIQRVNEASVKVDNKEIGSINKGFSVFNWCV